MPLTTRTLLRIEAAEIALRRIEAARTGGDGRAVRRASLKALLHDAERVYAWLTEPGPPASITLTAGPITDQRTGAVAPTDTGDTAMALELGDSQQVTITATPRDAEGQVTTDAITWGVDNTTAVKELEVSDDTLSVTLLGAVPATGVTLTATDAAGNSAPFVFDVVAGPATSLGLTAGPVTDQPAPPPAA